MLTFGIILGIIQAIIIISWFNSIEEYGGWGLVGFFLFAGVPGCIIWFFTCYRFDIFYGICSDNTLPLIKEIFYSYLVTTITVCSIYYLPKFIKSEIEAGEKRERETRHNLKNKFLEAFESNNYNEAINIKYIQNFSGSTSFDKDIEEKLAYCYLQIGRYREAISIYNRLIAVYSSSKDYKFNRALAKYKLNSADSKDLEEIYNKEKPFVILKEKMKLIFNDEEQKEANKIKKGRYDIIINPYKIGNIFGTYHEDWMCDDAEGIIYKI